VFLEILSYALPCTLCLIAGGVISFFDFHKHIVDRGNGKAPLPYLKSYRLTFFISTVSVIGAALFIFSSIYPSSWPNAALAFQSQNLYVRAVCVGISTIALLRIKFLESHGSKIGPDYIYEVFRGWAADDYMRRVVLFKSTYSADLARKILEQRDFRRKFIDMIEGAISLRDEKYKRGFKKECGELLKLKDTYSEEQINEMLIKMGMDYCGIYSVKQWINRMY
jgi:hypothetical protein